MTEQELREKLVDIVSAIWHSGNSHSELYSFSISLDRKKWHKEILDLFKEAGYVRAEDIETGYRKAGMQKVVDWVEGHATLSRRKVGRFLGEEHIELFIGLRVPKEDWQAFKKSEGVP